MITTGSCPVRTVRVNLEPLCRGVNKSKEYILRVYLAIVGHVSWLNLALPPLFATRGFCANDHPLPGATKFQHA